MSDLGTARHKLRVFAAHVYQTRSENLAVRIVVVPTFTTDELLAILDELEKDRPDE